VSEPTDLPLQFQRYIYWKLPANEAVQAAQSAYLMQQRLRERWPGLQARLWQREGCGPDGCVTWMETYAPQSGSLDGCRTVWSDVEVEAQTCLVQPFGMQRHIEDFSLRH
jgi:hypothetical protein